MSNKNLLQIIKQSAVEAVAASNPVSIIYGTVSSSKPLEIRIGQKLSLDEDYLILTRNVTKYKDNNDLIIDNELKQGEKVILIRSQGGQRYVVLDKVVDQ